MKLSIVQKLSISSIFLVLISAGVVAGIFHFKTTNMLVDHALKRISLEVQEAGTALLQIVANQDENILFLANTPPIQGILRARAAGGIDKKETTSYVQWVSHLEKTFESLIKRKSKYYQIRFIDKYGQEMVSVYRTPLKIIRSRGKNLQNKAHRHYVKDTLKLKAGEIYMSDINLNREFGEIQRPHLEVFRIATPIYDERNNKVAGLLVVTFEVGSELRAIQKSIRNNDNGTIYITNDHGGYLLHPNPEKTYGFDLDKRYRIQEDIPQLAEQFIPGNQNKYLTLMPHDTNGKDVVNFTKIAFDPSHPERFISVIMTQDYASIVAEESDLLNEIVIWSIFLVLLGVALAIIFAIRITRPIKQITQAVNEFSQQRTTTLNIPVNSTDEVGSLAKSFNSMIKQIEHSQIQLEDMNNNLEKMVQTRTNDLNKALVEAELANKSKSEFLSQMSHELRTPLNAILGFAQMLELHSENLNNVQQQNVQEIMDAGYHLLTLINDVLDLTRIESGNLEVIIENVSINKVIAQCIILIQPQATSGHLEIVNRLNTKEYFVKADSTRLKQVFLNLLSNAIKYNCDNGKIILDCKIIDKQRLRVSVIDSGEGLAEEDIDKLFTSFERLDKKNNVEGAGIGLVITKQLLDLMNGAIGVECAQAKGCTFWVELDLVAE